MLRFLIRSALLQLFALTGLALLSSPALAAGSNMPWEAPLQAILESIQGPVARIVALIIITFQEQGEAELSEGDLDKNQV